MSWNIEGLTRNVTNLDYFAQKFRPVLIFLSEPQVFQCDIKQVLQPLTVKYKFFLNSEDSYDESIPLDKSKAKGGTLALRDA